MLNVVVVLSSVLLAKMCFHGGANTREALSIACGTALGTLPAFHKSAQHNRKVRTASLISSFVIPFLMVVLWKLIG